MAIRGRSIEDAVFNDFSVKVYRINEVTIETPKYRIQFSSNHTNAIQNNLQNIQLIKVTSELETRANESIKPGSEIEYISLIKRNPFEFEIQSFGNYVYYFVKNII